MSVKQGEALVNTGAGRGQGSDPSTRFFDQQQPCTVQDFQLKIAFNRSGMGAPHEGTHARGKRWPSHLVCFEHGHMM
jgi:hypothetical protein